MEGVVVYRPRRYIMAYHSVDTLNIHNEEVKPYVVEGKTLFTIEVSRLLSQLNLGTA